MQQGKNRMPKNMYVGNLPYGATDADLANHFAKAGKVVKATVVMDRMTGKSRGFGFVEMATDEEGQIAIDTINGSDMQGRNLLVNEARPKESRPPSGGLDRHGGGGHRHGHGHGGGGGHGGGHGGGRPDYDQGGGSGNRSKGDWKRERHQQSRRAEQFPE